VHATAIHHDSAGAMQDPEEETTIKVGATSTLYQRLFKTKISIPVRREGERGNSENVYALSTAKYSVTFSDDGYLGYTTVAVSKLDF
jgi:hypothetical protein